MQRFDFVKTTDNVLGYTLFLPNNYTPTKTYPLILFLHGAGERGNGTNELEKCTAIGLGGLLKNGKREVNAIVLCPQCPTDRVWNHLVFDVKALVDAVANTYSVDRKKITVTGLSMGGFGTWEMGMVFPSVFAALAPVCGGGMAWRTSALKDKPIWAFHGDMDPTVDLSNSVDMVRGTRKVSEHVKFTVFNGVGHNAWDPAYIDTRVIDWLLEQSLT